MLKNLIPDHLLWCIAGGWAACPALASDMDVWVYSVAHTDLLDVRREIIKHLAVEGFEFETLDDKVKIGDYPDELQTKKVAWVTIGTTEIHLMVTTAWSPRELVNSFDISTHMVAIDQDGRVIRGEDWTPVSVPPRIVNYYPATQARLEKISARFGHEGETVDEDEIPF